MDNKILATVAGVEITERDIDAIIARYPEDRKAYFDNEMGRKQLLEQVIQFELMNLLGKERGIDKTEEYKETVKTLEKEILTQITISKSLEDVTITDADAEKYYNDHKEEFVTPPTVSAKHILVETEDQANEIKTDIEAGKITFEEAASKYSTCPSKEQGGSLGQFGKGMMVPEFEEVAFNAEVDTVTEPVKTQFGYHIIKVEAKGEETVATFEDVKSHIIEGLIKEAQQNKFIQLVKELESKYGVVRN